MKDSKDDSELSWKEKYKRLEMECTEEIEHLLNKIQELESELMVERCKTRWPQH